MKIFHYRRRNFLSLVSIICLLGWIFCLGDQTFAKGKTDSGSGSNGSATFSGQATVVETTVLGIKTVISDTGSLPSSGGALESSLLETEVPGLLTAEVLHATTIGQGDRSRSEASVANLDLTVGGNTISGDFLMARAETTCEASGPTATGGSELAGLVINGDAIDVTGEPNQTIDLIDGGVTVGKVIINEQHSSTNKKSADMTVNALHIIVNGVGDVVISHTHADITCNGKPPCTGGDFVTGGGWITRTPTSAKGNFGVAGGIKNGSFWGHLTYADHGSNLMVKGTGVTAYSQVDATTRHVEGTAEINGQSGFMYQVDVTDNGEPGRNDTFTIRLSSGYNASGHLEGGNIQLHQPCH